MSNFTFLQSDWPELYETAREAEQNVNSAPRTSCFYARRSLERAVKWLYANDSYLKQPYADNLAALIHEPTFRENLEPCLFPKILTIQKIGNLAVHVRLRLRELIKFLDKGEAVIVYTDFEDTIGEQTEIFVAGYASAEEMRQYRLKVERFIRDNANHITINKLRMNRQITRMDLEELERLLFTAEEVGNRERFEKVFGHQQSLGTFIRKLVGLDREAASEAFGEFLHNTTYSATQIRFIDQVVSYLTRNGTMDPGLLYEPPFTDLHNEGLDGVFGDAGATKIIHLLEEIELRAAA